MHLEFSKMHGLGNDFMVVDAVTQKIFFSPELIRRLGDRHYGVGFDQLLVVEPPYDPHVDFHYRIFNADGSEAKQCGNGARCIAAFVRRRRLTNKDLIRVSTISGALTLQCHSTSQVTVVLNPPNFEPSAIPFRAQKAEKIYLLRLLDHTLLCGVVSMGNPHCVVDVKDLAALPLAALGEALNRSERFPDGVNVGFMQINQPHDITLRVIERISGETLACGTGACAAVAVGIVQGKLAPKVVVHQRGGDLTIEWAGLGKPLYMTGPAEHIYDGVYEW